MTRDDAYADNGEEFTASITGSTGGGYENLVVGTGSVTTEIQDQTGSDNPPGVEDTTTLNIAGPATVVEGETATYTVSVTNPTATDLVVSVVTGHITTDDGDLVPVTTDVTIAAGTSSTTFDVVTRDDAYADNGEEFTASITGSTGGGYENLVVGTGSVTTEIQDQTGSDNPPGPEDIGATVSISGAAAVWEGNQATFTVTTDTISSEDIIVNVRTVEPAIDPATGNIDYVSVTTAVTILAGQSSADFMVLTIDDALADSGEKFVAEIVDASGAEFEAVGVDSSSNSVETTIIDASETTPPPGIPGTPDSPDVGATISISGAAQVEEGEVANYTVTTDTVSTEDIIVNVRTVQSIIDPATGGVDYTTVTTAVTILAGQTSANFNVSTIEDGLVEDSEFYVVEIVDASGSEFESVDVNSSANSVTTEITDDDNAPVAIDDPAFITGGLASEYYGYVQDASNPNLTSIAQVEQYVASNEAEITFLSTQINYGYVDADGDNPYDGGETILRGDLADDVAGGVPSNLTAFLKQDAPSINTVNGGSTEAATDGIIHMSGIIDIPADGQYTFDVQHDDGFVIYVDGIDIFNYDNITASQSSVKTIDLTGGQHTVEIFYWDQGGAYIFDLQLFEGSRGADDPLGPEGPNVWIPANLSSPVADPIVTQEEQPIVIDIAANDSDPDSTPQYQDLDLASIEIQSNPANGAVVVHNDGTVTYTPNTNFYGVDTFTYTIRDQAGNVSNVATVTVAVNAINDIPELQANDVLTVSEEALALGVIDGPEDAADTTTASGTLTIMDPDHDLSDLTISLSGPAGVTVGGLGSPQAVTWTWAESATNGVYGVLTGANAVTGELVATVTVADPVPSTDPAAPAGTYTAQYDVVLLSAINHDAGNGENNEQLTFTANVSDGYGSSDVNLVVNVEDDSIAAIDINQTLLGEQDITTTNLILTLDRSGSMADNFYGDNLFYLEVARDALKQLIDSADGAGNVNVMIVDFAANTGTSGWLVDDVESAYNYLDALIANGGTQYDTALNQVMSTIELTAMPPADQTFSYFVTDGVPNNNRGVDDTVTYTSDAGATLTGPAAWQAFLEDNAITESYAIGIGNVIANSNEAIDNLNDIAYSTDVAYVNNAGTTDGIDTSNPESQEENTILLSDPTDLANALLQAFSSDSITGTVDSTLGASGDSGFLLGADGGRITSITIDNVQYSYNPTTDTISADPITTDLTGLVSGANNEILTVTTDLGGEMMLNFVTGEYSYNITVTTTLLGEQEQFPIWAQDADGDTTSLNLTLDIDFTAGLDANRDNVITNIANGAPVVIPKIALLHNDAVDGATFGTASSNDGQIIDNGDEIIFTPVASFLSVSDFSTVTQAAVITEDDQASPNNTLATAVDMTDRSLFSSNNSNLSGLDRQGFAAQFVGSLASASDEDWFQIQLAEGENIHFDMDVAGFNTDVSIYDAQGNFIATIGENGGGAFDSFDAPSTGSYYVKVDSPTNSTGNYRLSMAIDTDQGVYNSVLDYQIDSQTGNFSDSTNVDVLYQAGTTLQGTDFDDVIIGGATDDTLLGGAGDDVLIGGAGNDILTGDTGSDLFVWSKADLGTAGTPAADQITDFNINENDVINLADVLSDGSHVISAIANGDGNLQLQITDTSSSNVVQTIDLNNVAAEPDTAAQLQQLLANNNIDDGIN